MVGFCIRFAFCPCHAFHIMSLCASHFAYVFVSCIRAFFPVVRFAIRHSYVLRRPPFPSFHERVLNILRIVRDLPSGLGSPPVDRLSSFVPFGLRLMLQRLTEGPKRPRVCCSPTPLQSNPITHPKPLHPLSRSITIAWQKTAPHFDSPSSLYL